MGAIIQIGPLSGATLGSSSVSLDLQSEDAQRVLQSQGNVSDALILSISTKAGMALHPGHLYILSFTVSNPSSGQASPSISISASNGQQTFTSTAIDKDLTTVLEIAGSGSGDAAPLYVSSPAIVLACP